MKKCLLNVCNGSGVVSLKDGSFVRCGCGRYVRAEENYSLSSAPKDNMIFIEDLTFNPVIQNMRKTKILEQKLKDNEISEEVFRDYMPKTFSPLKDVLVQYDDGKNGKPIKRFIKNNYKLFFFGDTGTGKSQSALSLALEGGKRNCKIYFLSLHEAHKLFRYNFNNEYEVQEVADKKRRIEEADILILDDLGKETETLNINYDSDLRLLKQIHNFIDGILKNHGNKLIIMTSNLNIEDMKKLYDKIDPRLSSMLLDGSVVSYQFRDKIRQKKKDDILDDLI